MLQRRAIAGVTVDTRAFQKKPLIKRPGSLILFPSHTGATIVEQETIRKRPKSGGHASNPTQISVDMDRAPLCDQHGTIRL